MKDYPDLSNGILPSSLNVTIRKAQSVDLNNLVEILASSFYSQSGVMRWLFPIMRLGIYEDIRQRLRSPAESGYTCLIAVPTARATLPPIVGTVEVAVRSTTPQFFRSNPYPYLSNLAVHPNFRRQGVALKLLRTCERTVIEQGYRAIYLHVLESNHAARQLYLKAGYEIYSADPLWCSRFLKRPRRLLLRKPLTTAPEYSEPW